MFLRTFTSTWQKAFKCPAALTANRLQKEVKLRESVCTCPRLQLFVSNSRPESSSISSIFCFLVVYCRVSAVKKEITNHQESQINHWMNLRHYIYTVYILTHSINRPFMSVKCQKTVKNNPRRRHKMSKCPKCKDVHSTIR